jgi:broad specificity phosphatase PhoE
MKFTMRMSMLTTVAVAVSHQCLAFTATAPKVFASRSTGYLQQRTTSSRITTRPRTMTTGSNNRALGGTTAHSQQTITSLNGASVPSFPDVAPTAKRLFLVRHGEVINPGGDRAVYYGAMDVPLSPLGEAEAEAAAQYLQQFDLQHIACSPLSRARFGAAKVAELQSGRSPSDVIVLDGFTEMDRGAWCGLTLDEIGPDLMARFDACDESVTPEGGESYPQLKNRVLQARDILLETLDCGRAAAVVSHLQVTRSILSEAMDLPISEMSKLKIATASITCIDYDGDVQTVHFQSFKPETELATSKDGAN